MGFFDFLKKKPSGSAAPVTSAPAEESPFTAIAKAISNGDRLVMLDAKYYTADPVKFFENHKAEYEKYGITSPSDPNLIQWVGLAESLIEQLYAIKVDSKTQCADFVWSFNQLPRMEEYHLTAREQWLAPAATIPQWCSALDDKWLKIGCCAAGLDMGKDCYVLFPIRLSQLEELMELGNKAGHLILPAKEL